MITPENIAEHGVIDVSDLQSTVFDYRAPLWSGNTLLLFIETAMFGILVTIYVSVMMNTDPFPPPRVDRLPVIYDPVPDLTLPVIGMIVLLVSLIPCIWLDISARRRNAKAVKIAKSWSPSESPIASERRPCRMKAAVTRIRMSCGQGRA